MNEKKDDQVWQCPSCGEINSMQNSFCKKCGQSHDQAFKSGGGILWKVIIGFILILLIGGGVFAGYLYWNKKTEEKQAKAYIQDEQKIFSDSVNAINGLSTETDLVKKYDSEKNKDLVVEKLNTEKTKAGDVTISISKMQQDSSQIKSNSKVDALNYLVKSYFVDAEKLTKKYDVYTKFILDDAKINVALIKEDEAFSNKFKTIPESLEGLIGYFKALKTMIDSEISIYDTLETPDGLADYKKPIDELKIKSEQYGELISALEKEDLKKLKEISPDVKNWEAVADATEKANGILEDYFSQMHNEFSSLRTKADKIKSEFIMSGAAFAIQPIDFNIEGW